MSVNMLIRLNYTQYEINILLFFTRVNFPYIDFLKEIST